MTFGNSNIGSTEGNGFANNIYACRAQAPVDCKVAAVSFYCKTDNDANFRAAVYKDDNGNPGALWAYSEPQTGSSSYKWMCFNLVTFVPEPPERKKPECSQNDYVWFAVIADNSFKYTYDSGGNSLEKSYAYSNFTALTSFGAPSSSGTQNLSMFAPIGINYSYNEVSVGSNVLNPKSGYSNFVTLKFYGTLTDVSKAGRCGSPLIDHEFSNDYLLLGARAVIECWAQDNNRWPGTFALITLEDTSDYDGGIEGIPIVQQSIYAETDTNRILDFYLPLNGYHLGKGRWFVLSGEIDNKSENDRAGANFAITVYALKA